VVAKAKVQLEYKLDPASPLANFIEWYEVAYRTTNENGRKRKGNAKKAVLDFLENYLKGSQKEIVDFDSSVKQFREDTKLPKELQAAKNNLSSEEYATFKELYEKVSREEEKNSAA